MRCAVYTRVSTDNQVEVEFNSCESQFEKIRSFINSQEDMEVFKVYSDPGFTGANLERPGLQQMLHDLEIASATSRPRNDKFIVIVYKMDRLTRSPRDFYQLIELFEKHNVDFISVTERFDTSTPSGRLLRNIMLTFAQFERELSSERTKDKMLQRANKGMWNGGIVPFGYKVENKKLVVSKKESDIIKNIYALYISTGSLAKTSAPHKDFCTKSSTHYILRNIIYTGKIKYAGKVYQGEHEPIITEEMFDLAQSIHKNRKRTLRLYKSYSLGGLLKCSECGTFMTPCHTNKRNNNKLHRYYYYRCTTTLKKVWDSCATKQVNANRLEEYIFDNLERISIDKHYLDSLVFTHNNKLSGDRLGYEPTDEYSEVTAEGVKNRLTLLLKNLPKRKGNDKNLWVKKFIKNINYSKEEIRISLFYRTHSGESGSLRTASGRVGAAAGRIPECGQKKSLWGTPEGLKMAPRVGLEPTTYWLRTDSHYCESRTIPLPYLFRT